MKKTTKPYKRWEDLSLKTQKRLAYLGDPRVPPGWTGRKPPDHASWEEASHRARCYRVRTGHPSVPPGIDLTPYLPSTAQRTNTRPGTYGRLTWEEASHRTRALMVKNGDVRVPPGIDLSIYTRPPGNPGWGDYHRKLQHLEKMPFTEIVGHFKGVQSGPATRARHLKFAAARLLAEHGSPEAVAQAIHSYLGTTK